MIICIKVLKQFKYLIMYVILFNFLLIIIKMITGNRESMHCLQKTTCKKKCPDIFFFFEFFQNFYTHNHNMIVLTNIIIKF